MGGEGQEDAFESASANDANGDSSAANKPLQRACDCCRKRKVKCDGDHPCSPCKKASIRCAYLQPPKKKGPKGLRSARVLHALRRIDDSASVSDTSTLSPEHRQAFGNWTWSQQNVSPDGVHFPARTVQQQQDVVYGPHTSVATDQSYFQTMPTSMPRTQQSLEPMLYQQTPTLQSWPSQAECVSAGSDMPQNPIVSPTASETTQHRERLPGQSFLPYMQLFYGHMFPIMPIIDRTIYLDASLYADSSQWQPEGYCFLCAICAATIVQLDESIPQPQPLYRNKRMDDLFVEQCLSERKTFDYIEPSTLSIMTSFFLFAYYGNHEMHAKAWHFLQESITFAENLNMDDDISYDKLDLVEAQWRRRLYWLLFITERAYAVQLRKHARLHPRVTLPEVFESEDSQLLNGFVNLAKLFAVVDDNFVRAWRGSRKASLCNQAWLLQTQEQLDKTAQVLDNLTETQHLDINVTREWLHVLAWQLGVSNGLMWEGEGGMRLDYPIELARKVVQITSNANALALDSHGIGMEQKLSDIAGCLADVLKCTAGDTCATILEGKQYLNILLQKLSSMRGKESRYLKPLMAKMEGWMGYDLNHQTLPLPTEATSSFPTVNSGYLSMPRVSIADSMGMLRTLSMSGNLGMPSLADDWTQRRPSGKVYDEAETDAAVYSWSLNNGMSQAV